MRREFPRAVKVAVIKRATRTTDTGKTNVYCESCGALAKRWQIDHVIADAHGGKPVIENAELICDACYGVKNPIDTTIAAKLKRQEAAHVGVPRSPSRLKSPQFRLSSKRKTHPIPMPARNEIYHD